MSADGVRSALRHYAHRAVDEAHPVDLRDGIDVELDRFAMHRAADLVAHAFADANVGDLVRLALRNQPAPSPASSSCARCAPLTERPEGDPR